jgi:glycosyltransferase involved in cell wall biosynthesis
VAGHLTVTDHGADGVLQYASHQYATHDGLIEPSCLPAPSARTGLDAIIVPAARPAKNLRTAVGLAAETGARLIVLCSFLAYAGEVRALLAEHKLPDATVVEMPQKCGEWLLRDFETARWVQGEGKAVCGARNSDLSLKRNTGLLLARMLGWDRIFFMDDDIRWISAEMVLSTVSLLGAADHGYRTAGMSVKDYPDNSVVCHARREVGEKQGVFVSGSVLAVDCRLPFDFFPDLYNEDWLFFHRDAAEGRLATPGSFAEQLPYDPFANPRRAAGQEFGDVIAEGLYALLHSGLRAEAADKMYWDRFLEDRNRVLQGVGRRLQYVRPHKRRKVSRAIGAAQQMLSAITPEMCADYVAAWQRDLDRWADVLADLGTAPSIEEALRRVGLR